MAVSKELLVAWFENLQTVYAKNREWLTELDSAIGDADHGINMDRGFTAVGTALAAKTPEDIRSVLQLVSTTLIRVVGGASGPLYGTFFLRAGATCPNAAELGADDVVAAFLAGIHGVQQRGKAELGDKTMLDALLPAAIAMQGSLENGGSISQILHAATTAAETGMKETIPMQARKGRASYLGGRSVGHQDPGATSAYLLLKTAADTWPDL